MTPDAIAAQLSLFIAPDQVTELRALNVGAKGRTFAGWFDGLHLRDLARHALALTRQASAIYFIPNSIDPSLLARRPNTVSNVVRSNGVITPELTRDSDVLSRRFLLVDLDPARMMERSDREHVAALRAGDPTGHQAEQYTAAIRGQHAPTHARELAFTSRIADRHIAPYLRTKGFADPIKFISGNGIHLVYRLSAPLAGGITNSNDPLALMLKHLSTLYDCAGLKVDPSTYTSARMLKVPGTFTRKGDVSPSRPHRMARIIEVPDGWISANTSDTGVAGDAARTGQLAEFGEPVLLD